MRYVVFATKTCPFCIKAKELIEANEKEIRVVNFEEDQMSVLQEIKEAHNWPTVPMIFKVDDDRSITFIGGYTDLIEYLAV
jgi:glutaredoxin